MKKAILILFVLLAALAPGAAHAGSKSFSVVLAGGDEANVIRIWLSPDGREYVIDSVVPLEVGGSVCVNPPENLNELVCRAAVIDAFQVNSGPGDDEVRVARKVTAPVTMFGGIGNDLLVAGSGDDYCPKTATTKCGLFGGPGDDLIVARKGDDYLYGGEGRDRLFGGPGDDLLLGGPGRDVLRGGPGKDRVRQ